MFFCWEGGERKEGINKHIQILSKINPMYVSKNNTLVFRAVAWSEGSFKNVHREGSSFGTYHLIMRETFLYVEDRY